MTSTMVRTVAVAALGVGAAVFGRTVEAAPNPSNPFVGKYTGPVPGLTAGDWGSISISSGGGIVFSQPPAGMDGWKFSGSMSADGTFSISGKYQVHGNFGWFTNDRPTPDATSYAPAAVPAKPAVEWAWYYQSTGTAVLGSDRNVYGTTTTGASFVWSRK